METGAPSPDAALAQSLAKLWPHRRHESSPLKALFCRLALHRWTQLDVQRLVPDDKQIRFCRWCSAVKIDGALYRP